MDARAWMIRKRRGGTFGPFTRAEIVHAIAEGELVALDEVRFGEVGAFQRLNEVATFAVALRETRHVASPSKMPWLIGFVVVVLLTGISGAWWLHRPSPEQRFDSWIRAQPLSQPTWLLDDVVIARETAEYEMCARLASAPVDDAQRFHALACRVAQQVPAFACHSSPPAPNSEWSGLDATVRAAQQLRPRAPWWWLMRALVAHAVGDHDVATAAASEAAALGGDTDAIDWTRALVSTANDPPHPVSGGSWLRASCLPHRAASRHFLELLLTAALTKPMWCTGGLCDLLVQSAVDAGNFVRMAQARPLAAVPHPLLILLTPRLSVSDLAEVPEPRPTAVQVALQCSEGDCTHIRAARPDRPWQVSKPAAHTLPGRLLAEQQREQALSAWRKGEDVTAWVRSVDDKSAVEDRFFAALFSHGAQPWPEMDGPLVPFWRAALSPETDETLRLEPLLERDDLYFSYNPRGFALYDAGLRQVAKLIQPEHGGRFLIDLARVWLGQPVTAPDILVGAGAALRRDWRAARVALEDTARDPSGADPSAIALLAHVVEQSGDEDALEWWKNLEDEASTATVLYAALRERARNGERNEAYTEALKMWQAEGADGHHDSRLATLLWDLQP